MARLKYVIMICAVLSSLLLAGCGDSLADYYSVDDTDITVIDSVELKTEFPEYDSDVKSINYTITNNQEDTFWYGLDFELHKYDEINERWEGVPFNEDSIFFAVGYGVEPGHTTTRSINLEYYFKLPLSPGLYRIDKGRHSGNDVIRAEFTIK